MMITKAALLSWLLHGATDAFVVVGPAQLGLATRTLSKRHSTRERKNKPDVLSTEETLARLEKEFRELQNNFAHDLEAHIVQEADAAELAESMLEMAVDITALQRYRQLELVRSAQKELRQSLDDLQRAKSLKEQAHGEAMSAEHEAQLLESIDAAYEDLERLRDLSVSHAAHHLEHDAKELEIESSFKELEASSQLEEAEAAIEQLEHNEQFLKDSLDALRSVKHDRDMEEWKKSKGADGPKPLHSLKELKQEHTQWNWKPDPKLPDQAESPKPLRTLRDLKTEHEQWNWKNESPKPLPSLEDLKREHGDWEWKN